MATYLVDLENTGLAGLTGLDELSARDKVIVFYGTRTGSIAFDKHVELTKAKADVTYTKTERVAKNYLDFQLVTYLGYLIGSGQERVYYIISKDKGYDSCIEFWRKTDKQIAITRCESLQKQKNPASESAAADGKTVSAQKPSGKKPSARKSPKQKASAQQAPEQKASAQQTPEQGASEQNTPAQGTSAQKESTQGMPAQKESTQGMSAQKESAQGMSAQKESTQETSAQNVPEQGASAQNIPVQNTSAQGNSGKTSLPESMRKKIRKAVKDEALASGSYKFIYDYVVQSPDKQKLNVALVKRFQQEKGNRLYKEILDVFSEYHKQKT